MKYTSIIKPPESKNLKSGRVVLEPGEDVGDHVTKEREEIIIILSGTATIILKENEKLIENVVKENETFYIPS